MISHGIVSDTHGCVSNSAVHCLQQKAYVSRPTEVVGVKCLSIHDVNAEQDEDPAQNARKIARPHAQRAAEPVIPGDKDRGSADLDQQHASPEIPLVANFQFHKKIL